MPIIRSGRCNECRRRRRKCNEGRPSCALCLLSGTNCVYGNAITAFVHTHQSMHSSNNLLATAQNTTLKLRSVRNSSCGSGQYLTFTTSRIKQKKSGSRVEPDAIAPLHSSVSMSKAERLSSEYVFLLSLDATVQNCSWLWQSWSVFVPSRVGSSPLLDCAVACVLETYRARQTFDGQAEDKARRYYGQALVLLQHVIRHVPKSVTGQVIAATKMLESFETSFGNEVQSWQSHVNGAVQLFLALGPRSCQNDFERALFYTTYGTVLHQALASGEPSPFDTAAWLDIGLPPLLHPCIGPIESQRRFRIFTQFPRLASLVRAVRIGQKDETTVSTATSLLHDVISLEWPRESSSGFREAILTSEQELTVPPSTLEYPAPKFQNAFVSSVRCMSRIMLCGICQNAFIAGVPFTWPSVEEVRREEQRCALLICRSIPILLTTRWKHNIAAALLLMRIAWGALWRRAEWDSGRCDRLISWLEAQLQECGAVLGLEIDRDDLLEFTQIWDGSPLGEQ